MKSGENNESMALKSEENNESMALESMAPKSEENNESMALKSEENESMALESMALKSEENNESMELKSEENNESIALKIKLINTIENTKALITASHDGDLDLIRSLLNKGVFPTIVDVDGGPSAFQIAYYSERKDMLDLISSFFDKCHKTLVSATLSGNAETVLVYLQHGIEATMVPVNGGKSAFQIAMKHSRKEIQQFMLHYAAKDMISFISAKHVDHVIRMVVQGVDPCRLVVSPVLSSKNPICPIQAAVICGSMECIVVLFHYGKEGILRVVDHENRTLLHLACMCQKEQIVCMILRHKDGRGSLDINKQDNFTWTPLSYAAYFGHAMSVRVLLRFGADHKLKDGSDRSPYRIALEYKHEEAALEIIGWASTIRRRTKFSEISADIDNIANDAAVTSTSTLRTTPRTSQEKTLTRVPPSLAQQSAEIIDRRPIRTIPSANYTATTSTIGIISNGGKKAESATSQVTGLEHFASKPQAEQEADAAAPVSLAELDEENSTSEATSKKANKNKKKKEKKKREYQLKEDTTLESVPQSGSEHDTRNIGSQAIPRVNDATTTLTTVTSKIEE